MTDTMIFSIRLGLAIAISVAAFSRVDGANEYFVNNVYGDDLFDGSVAENIGNGRGPLRSITRALEVAGPRDQIVVADAGEPYRESFAISRQRHSGEQDRPFTIRGNGAVIDGTVPISPRAWKHVSGNVWAYRPWHKTFNLLFLEGVPLQHIAADRNSIKRPLLEPFQWCLFRGNVYLRLEEKKVPADYDLAHTGLQTGLTIYAARNVVVSGLIFQGFRLDGVNVADLSTGILLEGVTARGNGRSGVSVGGSSRVWLEQSLIGDNGTVQVRTEGHSHLTVVESEILDNTAPKWKFNGGRISLDGKRLTSSD